MRTVTLNLAPTTASSTGLTANTDSSGTSVVLGGALTSNGVFTSPDGMGRIITIKDSSSNTQSDVTFTLTGTDTNNDAISETITGPASGATVVSTKYFYTISAVAVSIAQGGTEKVDIGIRGTTLSAVSQVIPLNFYDEVAPEISVDVTGTINVTVQQTFDSILTIKDSSGAISWENITALTSQTADISAQTSIGAKAVRVIINTYSTSATVQVAIISSYNDLLDPVNNIGASVTIAATDKVLIKDVSDNDKLKTATAQSIANLVLIGTTTNDNASVGNIGYFYSVTKTVGSPVALTSDIAVDVASLTLAAGDYDVWGNVGFLGGGTTTFQYGMGWQSITSATQPTRDFTSSLSFSGAGQTVFGGTSIVFNIQQRRVSLASSTTLYLSVQAGFGISTCSAFGNLFARVRR